VSDVGQRRAQDDEPASAVEAGRAFIRLGSRLHRLQVEVLEGLSIPLSVRQFRILERVGRGTSSLGMLAGQARRKPATISKSADSLVRQGLLTRTEAAQDRRALVLALTPAGRRLLAEATAAMSRLAVALAEAAPVSCRELGGFAESVYQSTEAWVAAGSVPQAGDGQANRGQETIAPS